MKYHHSIPWRIVTEDGLPLIVSEMQPGYIAQFFDDDGNARENAEFVIKAANAYPYIIEFMTRLDQHMKERPNNKTARWIEGKLNEDMCRLRELIAREHNGKIGS